MWISGTSQYAIRAVVYIATHGAEGPVQVTTMAAALKVPRNYLSKTLHQLARANVLRSTRGPLGGFQLAAPAADLTLARVTAPFDEAGSRQCLLGRPSCSDHRPCGAHARWSAVSDSLDDFFQRTTIADLVGKDGVRKP